MNATDGVWLSINDYSRYKDVSISTIRRHIKTNILKHKEENGKYFIYVPSVERVKLREDEELLKVKLENQLLKTQLRDLREELDELKMLVDVYERKADAPPELPGLHE
jgi:hypothetical protein